MTRIEDLYPVIAVWFSLPSHEEWSSPFLSLREMGDAADDEDDGNVSVSVDQMDCCLQNDGSMGEK